MANEISNEKYHISKLYARLSEERDKNIPRTNKYNHENDVFIQLLEVTFKNSENPDALPKRFFIHNVVFQKDEFDELLERIEINAETNIVNNSFLRGNTFEVILRD